ncbi:MAG: energy transducer TonB [Candidatus Angelobacter sp.]
MFREALLDSSPLARQNKRWVMTIAFAVEILAASVAVLVPLVSTDVLPISQHIPLIAPLRRIAVPRQSSPTGPADRNPQFRGTAVVPLTDSPSAIRFGHALTGSTEPATPQPGETAGQPNGISLTFGGDASYARPKPPVRRRPIVISRFDEAQLLKKVNPIYPRMAALAGIAGIVKLHAIVAKDGDIQSLTVVSGHPMLARAALDAVKQWRYRPYLLNGKPVEVETFITVVFRKTGL